MCGIAGYLAWAAGAAPPSRGALARITSHMARRGPDGDGYWHGDRVGFGHRRLSIIELTELGAQPMHSADGHFTITFNGEIYNFQALRDALEAEGARFASHSDTEVILQLYARHGAAALPMLRGMFALAIWDAREEALLLARDPFGIKPLYYACEAGVVRFASQVKALLADPAVSRDPSPAGLAGFHLFGAVPEPHTMYEAIKAVPAGSTVRIDARGVGAPVRWAHVPRILAGAGDEPVNAASALRESVRHHLVADVEVGAFLSGGVDSSALIGLMRDCGQDRIKACTLAFEAFAGTPADEAPRARRVAAHYDVEHHVDTVTAAEFAADLPAIFEAMDQPSVDGINSWFVSKACREMGLKVTISGLGGDELLAGYTTFRDVPRTRRLAGPLARLPFAALASRALIKRFAPDLARRNPKLLGLLDLPRSWAGAYLLRRSVLLPFELDNVMDPAMARAGLAALAPLESIADTMTPDPGSDVGRVAALEMGNYMRNQLLRDTDWASMAHSLEVRVPLVDFTLLGQLAPMLPKLEPGQGKRLLAAAPSKPVPAEIVETAKTGFAIPVRSLLGGESGAADRRDARVWGPEVLARYAPEQEPALAA